MLSGEGIVVANNYIKYIQRKLKILHNRTR